MYFDVFESQSESLSKLFSYSTYNLGRLIVRSEKDNYLSKNHKKVRKD